MGQTMIHLKHPMNKAATVICLFAFFLIPAFLQSQVSVTVTGTTVTCFDGNNGTATAIGSGGSAPYTYAWSNGASAATLTGLTAGTYSVTVTDTNQGSAVGSVMVAQPSQLGVQVFGESQICGIAPDGKATAVPYGGVPPYSYLWNNGGTSAQITGLAAGTYTVTITDANNCTTTGSATVFFWDEGLWLMDSSVNVSCWGGSDGFVYIAPMSGTPPYTYLWSTGATTAAVSGLLAGNYNVTVTDVNGCSAEWPITLTQPDQVVLSINTTNGVCGQNGTATVTIVSGGTPPFTILWSTGATTNTITGPPGTYTVTVTDANDCVYVGYATILATPNPLVLTGTVLGNAGCTVGGVATVTVTGGSGNYSYTWDNGQTTPTATNLMAGNHAVTVIDIATGCMTSATVNIPAAPLLVVDVVANTEANCLVGGSATVTISGGTPTYTIGWDNGQSTPTATNLGAGPHNVTVTDAGGCIEIKTVTIGQAQGPSVTVVVNSNASCTANDGNATATATGGTPPYVFFWDNGETTATADSLSPGVHTVTVTDAGGCAGTAMATIIQSSAPIATATATADLTCIALGSATANPAGGTPPYTYLWNGGQNTQTITGLQAGTYSVTVTDANMCTATASVSIAAPIPPNVVITGVINAICGQPGSATASAAGGAGGYIYNWSNGETTETAINLPAGTYTVTVTDAGGCTATASVTIQATTDGISIGDYVWYDNDQDGFQHPFETAGVPNVKVMLMKPGPDGVFGTADDVTSQTDTTDAAGKYLFNCVTPGTYVLMFGGIPAGYEFTGKDQVNNDCKDSDAKSNGKTDAFVISQGQGDNLCFDAGIHIICENVTYPGNICCSQTICEGDVPAALFESVPPAGGSGPLEYLWMQLVQMGPAPPSWVGIPGATQQGYQPGALYETSYFMRCVRRQGCETFLESNIVTITVLPAGSPGCETFIMDFSVAGRLNNSVLIEWTSEPEAAQYLYTVEHSTNMTDWKAVRDVPGLHLVSSPNHYNVVDLTPASGSNYYRIRRTNQMGTQSLSETREAVIEFTESESVVVSPNPVSKVLNVRNLMVYEEDVTITLNATNGAVIYTLNIPKQTLQEFEIPVENLPAGIYLARILYANGDVRTIKVAKF